MASMTTSEMLELPVVSNIVFYVVDLKDLSLAMVGVVPKSL